MRNSELGITRKRVTLYIIIMNFIDKKIEAYSDGFTSSQDQLLTELLERTYETRADKSMLSGFYQGRLLAMLSKMTRPKTILEIGTYMGYSALCLAEGLAEDGKVITLDIQPETHAVAKEFWARSPLNSKIDGRLGDALEIIPTIEETIDLVFIDADKPNYKNYYDLIFPKLKIGGIILADNVLWSGDVLNVESGKTDNESSIALHEFNKKIRADGRVSNILLTVRDGLMVIRKETD